MSVSPVGASTLVGTVSNWLQKEALPQLQGAVGFNARVAVNALNLAVRELTLGPAAEDSERARLAALLGRDGDLQSLRDALAESVATGAMAIDDSKLLNHLRLTVIDRLAIDQPNYSAYLRATEAGR